MGSGGDETYKGRMYMPTGTRMVSTTPTMLVQHVELVGWKATNNGGYWTLLLHAL